MAFTRRSHLKSMFAAGIWGRWLSIAWGLYGIFAALREEVVPPQDEQKYRLIALVPHMSLSWWLVGALALFLAWLFEASYRARAGDVASTSLPYGPPMTHLQEKLLALVVGYLKQFGVKKLIIIIRENSSLFFDNDPSRGKRVDMAYDIYRANDSASREALTELIESMPAEYLKLLPNMRWGGPFVVAVTDAGLRYLREHKL